MNRSRLLATLLLTAGAIANQTPRGPQPSRLGEGRKLFQGLCAMCHGAEGGAGERGPSIADRRTERTETIEDLRELIQEGLPGAGMPGFSLSAEKLGPLVEYVRSLTAPAMENPAAGDVNAGEAFFFGKGRCSSCHMIRGRGGLVGPDLTDLGRIRKLAAIEEALRGSPASMPGCRSVTVRLKDGRQIRGVARNESNYDLQLVDVEGRLHLLAREEIAERLHEDRSLMPPLDATEEERRNLLAFLSRLSGIDAVDPDKPQGTDNRVGVGGLRFEDVANPRTGEWPTYHGHLSGNRHSPLRQIHTGNVASLAPRWMFPIADSLRLEVTPVVADGVMYVTTVNQAYALDARTGREIWRFKRSRTKGVIGDAAGGINRGVAVLGDKVFLVTDHAHLLALHRMTGSLLWEVEMADYRKHYGATSAPLVVKDLVISGTSGGDEGVRGFVAAYRASTGERVWRFWTVPAPGEPAATTWGPKALEHGCAAAWLTGTYDPATDLLFWNTGNPCPDYNGDERPGDNLYSDTILALKPGTGELRWRFQFTPHDVHDWDSAQTPMLIDAEYQGRPRRLLVQANRNGFLYVLDRADGTLLLAKPFVAKLTWATGVGPDGQPLVVPGTDPTPEGVKVCPSVEGATNWMSTAWNPETRLFYVMALEKCDIYTKTTEPFEQGRSFYQGAARAAPGEPGRKVLRAIDIESGKIIWEYPQAGQANSWGGVLSTAGGLVFFGDDSGAFAAVDASSGRPLWHFHTNQLWKASPMTYMAAGRQFVAVAAGSNVIAFALPGGQERPGE